MEIIFGSAIALGLLGSMHCIGMCGPIALALPIGGYTASGKWLGSILYNFGRAFTYAIIGALFGLIGQSFSLAGWQQYLSILLGTLLVVSVLLPKKQLQKFKITSRMHTAVIFLKSKMGRLIKKKSYSSLFTLGLLNGLLPCGLVYVAVAAALATGNVIEGSVFMFLFGLGTIPAMLSMMFLGNVISINFRAKIKQAFPVIMIFMGLLFILRGMNLGIPYISPQVAQEDCTIVTCCKKIK